MINSYIVAVNPRATIPQPKGQWFLLLRSFGCEQMKGQYLVCGVLRNCDFRYLDQQSEDSLHPPSHPHDWSIQLLFYVANTKGIILWYVVEQPHTCVTSDSFSCPVVKHRHDRKSSLLPGNQTYSLRDWSMTSCEFIFNNPCWSSGVGGGDGVVGTPIHNSTFYFQINNLLGCGL